MWEKKKEDESEDCNYLLTCHFLLPYYYNTYYYLVATLGCFS